VRQIETSGLCTGLSYRGLVFPPRRTPARTGRFWCDHCIKFLISYAYRKNPMNETLLASIRLRYRQTLDRIARRGLPDQGASRSRVRLVVVSKSQPLEVIQAACAAGISIFGENYAEEAVQKIAALQETNVEWHMIGHVQSRKADLIGGALHHAPIHWIARNLPGGWTVCAAK